MKNKKGVLANIIGVFVVLIVVIGVCILIPVNNDDRDICKNQCSLQNLTFYEYNPGGHRNPACLCKNDLGIIKTIYTK
jgi:hypothetical protein